MLQQMIGVQPLIITHHIKVKIEVKIKVKMGLFLASCAQCTAYIKYNRTVWYSVMAEHLYSV